MMYNILEKKPKSERWEIYRRYNDQTEAIKTMNELIGKQFEYGYEYRMEEVSVNKVEY